MSRCFPVSFARIGGVWDSRFCLELDKVEEAEVTVDVAGFDDDDGGVGVYAVSFPSYDITGEGGEGEPFDGKVERRD